MRLDENERALLKSRIRKTGLSQEAYLRILINGRIPKEKPDDRFYTVTRELAAIGNNIHQLSAKANALGFIDAPLLAREVQAWGEFRLAIRRRFLDAEKASDKMGPL